MSEEGAELTAEEFLALPDEKEYELIGGKLRKRQGGGWSSWVGGRLFNQVADHAHARHLGWAFPAGTGYQCFPDKPNQILKPSASFIRHGRFPDEQLPWGPIRIAADLAVEILYPGVRFAEICARMKDYLRAGTALVWVIKPPLRSLLVYLGNGSGNRLREGDQLTGGAVLPGFECPVAALFLPAGTNGTIPAS